MCEDVDLLAEQQTGIEIMHVNGGAGERFNQVTLDRRQLTFPAEVLSDAPSDGIELLARFGPPVDLIARKQPGLTLPVPTRDRGRICRHFRTLVAAPVCTNRR